MRYGYGYGYGALNQGRRFSPTQISNLALWLDASDLTTITKDGSNYVSEWKDIAIPTRKVVQAIASSQPLWSNNSIIFDGVNDVLNGSGIPTIAQPFTEVFVIKQLSWTINKRLIDHDGYITQTISTPRVYCNGGSSSTSNLPVGQRKGVAVVWKHTNTTIKVSGNTSEVIGSNANQFSALKLGGDTGAYANFELYEYIVYSGEKTATEIQKLENFLINKWGLT